MLICRAGEELEIHRLELMDAAELDALKVGYTAYRGEWLYHGSPEPFIRASLERIEKNEGFWAALRYQEELAGVVGLNDLDSWGRCAKIDYLLGVKFRGKGLMTRAVEALTSYAFDTLGLNRIEIHPDMQNVDSRAIPERLGFRLEGVLHQKFFYGDVFGDCAMYAMLADDWKSRTYKFSME